MPTEIKINAYYVTCKVIAYHWLYSWLWSPTPTSQWVPEVIYQHNRRLSGGVPVWPRVCPWGSDDSSVWEGWSVDSQPRRCHLQPQTHTEIHTDIHTDIQTDIHTDIQTDIHTNIYTGTYTLINASQFNSHWTWWEWEKDCMLLHYVQVKALGNWALSATFPQFWSKILDTVIILIER